MNDFFWKHRRNVGTTLFALTCLAAIAILFAGADKLVAAPLIIPALIGVLLADD